MIITGATTRKIRVVQKEGNRDVARDIDFYNLDAITQDKNFESGFDKEVKRLTAKKSSRKK